MLFSWSKRLSIYKRLWILSFARNVSKNIIKHLSSKHTQKLRNHAKQSATDAIKNTSKRAIQKIVEATGDSIGNKFADKITRVSKKTKE